MIVANWLASRGRGPPYQRPGRYTGHQQSA
jgi:hypothetical protein